MVNTDDIQHMMCDFNSCAIKYNITIYRFLDFNDRAFFYCFIFTELNFSKKYFQRLSSMTSGQNNQAAACFE